MPRKTSTHACEAEGCTTKTLLRNDGQPRKYCPIHTVESRERMKAIFAEGAILRDLRREEFQTIVDAAHAKVEATKRQNDGKIGLIVGPGNSAFVHFLKAKQCGEQTSAGWMVRLPRDGSASVMFDALKPLTAAGEPLEGVKIKVI